MNKIIKFGLLMCLGCPNAPMTVDQIAANPQQACDTINDLEAQIRGMRLEIERLIPDPELNPEQMDEVRRIQEALDDELRTEEMSLEGIALRYPEQLRRRPASDHAWTIPSSTTAPSVPETEHSANPSMAPSVISAHAPSTAHTQPGPVPQPLYSRTLAVDNDQLRKLVSEQITARATYIVATYDQLREMHKGGGRGAREEVTELLANYKSLMRRFIRYSESYYFYNTDTQTINDEWSLVRKIQDYLISRTCMPTTLAPFIKKFNVNMKIFDVISKYINREYQTFSDFNDAARTAMQQ